MTDDPILPVERIALADLKPHPRNYRGHPEDQVDHLAASIRQFGMYRNIVAADDLTILAGHGVSIAAAREGIDVVPVIRMPFGPDDPRALVILAGDNETGLRATTDDRALSTILRDISTSESVDLLGTGYDDAMLANLVYISRDANEIADLDAAAQWVGMPEFDAPRSPRLIISFDDTDARVAFIEQHGITVTKALVTSAAWQAWWPARERDDVSSVKFVDVDDTVPASVDGVPGVDA